MRIWKKLPEDYSCLKCGKTNIKTPECPRCKRKKYVVKTEHPLVKEM